MKQQFTKLIVPNSNSFLDYLKSKQTSNYQIFCRISNKSAKGPLCSSGYCHFFISKRFTGFLENNVSHFSGVDECVVEMPLALSSFMSRSSAVSWLWSFFFDISSQPMTDSIYLNRARSLPKNLTKSGLNMPRESSTVPYQEKSQSEKTWRFG